MATKFSAFLAQAPVSSDYGVGYSGSNNIRYTFSQLATLIKSLVLPNVDNTSDVNKPVSTAQQTALDLKANLASPTFTGVPAGPTAAAGTNTTQFATTAYVIAERATTATLSGKTLTAPTFSGLQTMDGASVVTRYAMPADAIDTSKAINTTSRNANATFTFNAAPTSGTIFGLEITNSGATARTMTLPAGCLNANTLAAITTMTLPASGMLSLTFRYNGTNYLVDGGPAAINLATDVSGNLQAANVNSGTNADSSTYLRGDMTWAKIPVVIPIAVGDETTAITTGNGKVTFRMPFAMTLTEVRASLTTASSSGLPQINVKEGGTTIFSTNLTIDASEKTSTTAATPAVISDASLANDAEITIDIVAAGTGAAGLKVYLIGTRT